jgi:hypothetical protein
MITARGIDERGNSRILHTSMPVAVLEDVLLTGGWKYAMLDSGEVLEVVVTAVAREMHRAWHVTAVAE